MRPRSLRPAIVGGVVLIGCLLSACSSPEGAPAATSTPGTSPSSSASKASTPSPSATIEPVVVVAAVDPDGKHLTASGYVQGLVEESGTCTFVFSREGSADVPVQHDAVADRQTTSCGTVQPDLSQFTRGTWNVVLRYASGGRTYTSQASQVEVP